MTVETILEKIVALSCRVFGENLVGVYLHGSLAFGCFRWEKSDIDFLVVVHTEPELAEKLEFIGELLRLNESAPPKGLEMSVVTESVCREFVHPTPYELHFSNAHREAFCADLEGYCQRMQGVDPDLAAHFTVIRQVGQVLWGEKIENLFGEVPREAYWDSIRGDIAGAVEEIGGDPVYYILNLCRVLAFLQEGRVLSKEQGGRWGEENLPAPYCDLAARAGEVYRRGGEFASDAGENCAFAEYLLEWIFSGAKKLGDSLAF